MIQVLPRHLIYGIFCLSIGTISGFLLGNFTRNQFGFEVNNDIKKSTILTSDYQFSICDILKPKVENIEELGNLILSFPSPFSNKSCERYVTYVLGWAGIGHRLGNWMANQMVSLAWGVTPVLGEGLFLSFFFVDNKKKL
jgi:hypothetical protein